MLQVQGPGNTFLYYLVNVPPAPPGEGPMTVEQLQKCNFPALPLQQKLGVLKRGRPKPMLQMCGIGISNNKKYVRSFNEEWYDRKDWLCGCSERNALFCFPCVLYRGSCPMWVKVGFSNVSKMKDKSRRHELTKEHINSVTSLALVECQSADVVTEANRISICEHNREVTRNREILSKIIDCIKFCGQFEIPFRGQQQNPESSGGLGRLMYFASKMDPDLRKRLENSAAFTDVSEAMLNDILDCFLQVCRDEIKREIKESKFAAVMVEDTSGISEHVHLAIVVRYELNGEILERFWGLFTPDKKTVDGISKCILDQLEIILEKDVTKLVSQALDGAIFMKGKKGEVQLKIKQVYPNAHLIHCYAHKTDQMIRNVASSVKGPRIFVSNFMSIANFFANSPHVAIHNRYMNGQLPTEWNYYVRPVCEKFESLKKCLEEIQTTSNSDKTISEATGILYILNCESFKFWLELFNQMIPRMRIIHNQLQAREIETKEINNYVAEFVNAMQKISDSKYCENPSKMLATEAKVLCDNISVDIAERYSFTKQISASKIFNKEQFVIFSKTKPAEEVVAIAQAYSMISSDFLLAELEVFYQRKDLHDYRKLTDLLKFLVDRNLVKALGEVTKLVRIFLTIPMATSESDRCLETFERIKQIINNTENQERVNAVLMLLMEKNFINNEPSFNEKVINLFSSIKGRSEGFSFK